MVSRLSIPIYFHTYVIPASFIISCSKKVILMVFILLKLIEFKTFFLVLVSISRANFKIRARRHQ